MVEYRWWLAALALYLYVVGHLEGIDPAKPEKMRLLKHSLVTAIGAFGLAIAGLARRRTTSERGVLTVLWGLALALLVFMNRTLIVSHVDHPEYMTAIGRLALTALAFVAIGYVLSHQARYGTKLSHAALLAAIGCLLVSRALVLWASTEPRIDVFTLAHEASAALWRGENPYAADYGNLYAGTKLDLGYSPGYNYFPLMLLSNALSDLVFHDVRAGYVLFEALSAFALFRFGRALGLPLNAAALLALVWCANALSLQVVEKWNDSVGLAALFLALAMLAEQRWLLAGIALGFGTATKQYLPLALLPIGLWMWKTQRDQRSLRMLAIGFGASAAALFLPFLLHRGDWFLARTLLHFGRTPFRDDSISLLNAARILLGFGDKSIIVRLAPYAGLALGLGIASAVVWRCQPGRSRIEQQENLHRLVVALLFVWSGFFHFIKQSFLNYYFFLFSVSTLLLVTMIRRAEGEREVV